MRALQVTKKSCFIDRIEHLHYQAQKSLIAALSVHACELHYVNDT